MSLFAFAAAKGAPGVTTTALALAAVWPSRLLFADCDPAGSDVPWRLRAPGGEALDRRRSLLSLTARLPGSGPGEVWAHVQTVAGGLHVLTGVPGMEHARAVGGRWEDLADALAALDVDVLADCGRLDPTSPVWPLAAHARIVVTVVRPTVPGVGYLRQLLTALGAVTARAAVVVVTDDARLVGEMRAALAPPSVPVDVTVLGPLAVDPTGAALLFGGPAARLDRTPLIRSARPVAAHLASLAVEASGVPR